MTIQSVGQQNPNYLTKQQYIEQEKEKANRWLIPGTIALTLGDVAFELIEK